MSGRKDAIAIVTATLLLGGAYAMAQPSTVGGIFTAEQVTVGQREYLENCAGCHGNSLSGGNDSPALAGTSFISSWGDRSTKALYRYISTTMPVGNAGNLSAETYTDIMAFLLAANGAKSGNTIL